MQLIVKAGSVSIRHNANMRSLWIEYPRIHTDNDVLAVLFNRRQSDKKFRLPVLTADASGIEIKLPSFLTGMFYVKIQDGEHSFLREIALQ